MTTSAEARQAEVLSRDQRMANFKLLQVDAGKASNPEDAARAGKLWETAQNDPLKFDGELAKPEVRKMFACGALHFRRT